MHRLGFGHEHRAQLPGLYATAQVRVFVVQRKTGVEKYAQVFQQRPTHEQTGPRQHLALHRLFRQPAPPVLARPTNGHPACNPGPAAGGQIAQLCAATGQQWRGQEKGAALVQPGAWGHDARPWVQVQVRHKLQQAVLSQKDIRIQDQQQVLVTAHRALKAPDHASGVTIVHGGMHNPCALSLNSLQVSALVLLSGLVHHHQVQIRGRTHPSP